MQRLWQGDERHVCNCSSGPERASGGRRCGGAERGRLMQCWEPVLAERRRPVSSLWAAGQPLPLLRCRMYCARHASAIQERKPYSSQACDCMRCFHGAECFHSCCARQCMADVKPWQPPAEANAANIYEEIYQAVMVLICINTVRSLAVVAAFTSQASAVRLAAACDMTS